MNKKQIIKKSKMIWSMKDQIIEVTSCFWSKNNNDCQGLYI